jgi:hypothetical protein
MKYIKTYEERDEIEYCVGDTVYCIDDSFYNIGTKLIINEIFKYSKYNSKDSYNDNNPEKIFLKCLRKSELNETCYVNVRTVDGNNSHYGIYASRFVNEKNYNIYVASNKYNL